MILSRWELMCLISLGIGLVAGVAWLILDLVDRKVDTDEHEGGFF